MEIKLIKPMKYQKKHPYSGNEDLKIHVLIW
jgi:hypothetical protein